MPPIWKRLIYAKATKERELELANIKAKSRASEEVGLISPKKLVSLHLLLALVHHRVDCPMSNLHGPPRQALLVRLLH